MPGPITMNTTRRLLPDLNPTVAELLDQISLNPQSTAVWSGGGAGEPMLKSLGKTLGELMDAIFTPKAGAKLPQRMRFTGVSREGNMQFHGPNDPIGPARFEASPGDVDKLINGGALDLEQPPARATAAVQSKLRQMLDATLPEFKDEQVTKRLSNPSRRSR